MAPWPTHIFVGILVDSMGEETVPSDRGRERDLSATRNMEGGHFEVIET